MGDNTNKRVTNIKWGEDTYYLCDTFEGATTSEAGTEGLVPAPAASEVNKFLKGNGSWGAIERNAVGVDGLVKGTDFTLRDKVWKASSDGGTPDWRPSTEYIHLSDTTTGTRYIKVYIYNINKEKSIDSKFSVLVFKGNDRYEVTFRCKRSAGSSTGEWDNNYDSQYAEVKFSKNMMGGSDAPGASQPVYFGYDTYSNGTVRPWAALMDYVSSGETLDVFVHDMVLNGEYTGFRDTSEGFTNGKISSSLGESNATTTRLKEYVVKDIFTREYTPQDGLLRPRRNGLVPAPAASEVNYFLRGDGSWANITATDEKLKSTTAPSNTEYPILFKSTSSGTTAETALFNSGVTVNGTGGQIKAASFKATSAKKYKDNIKHSVLDAEKLINDTEIVEFNFKNQTDPKIGFIADYTDSLLATPNHDTMDLYNCIGVLMKASQQMSSRIEALEKRVSELENRK